MNRNITYLAILVIFGIFFVSCFEAERNNPNDWRSSQFKYNVHVSVTSGDDLNDGSITSPVKSIDRAIDLTQPGNSIAVEEGEYMTALALNLSGIKIYGGFKSGTVFDPFQRDPWSHTSLVYLEGTLSGNVAGDPFCTVAITGNSCATVIDGFTIRGPYVGSGDQDYVSTIKITGSSDVNPEVSIANCKVLEVSAMQRATAIYIGVGTPHRITISQNFINDDSSESGSSDSVISQHGVYIHNSGSGFDSIYIWNNVIQSGKVYLSGTGQTGSVSSIYCNNASPRIYNNTIISDSVYYLSGGSNGVRKGYGIFLSNGSAPSIKNNIIHLSDPFHHKYGIYEDPSAGDPVNVSYNCMMDNDLIYYYDKTVEIWGITDLRFANDSSTVASINGPDLPNYTYYDELFANELTYELSSSAAIEIREAATMSEFTVDIYGKPRTSPYSMGAHEFDE